MTSTSIIVAVHNAAGTLGPCIEALLGQEGVEGDFEVLVVDNNSTDGSLALAQRYAQVRVLSEPKQGAYSARNRGLEHSSGDLVAFTDSDCVAQRDWLACLQERLQDPRIKVVMGRDRPAGESLAVRLLGEYDHGKESLVMSSTDPAIYYGHTNNLMTRRSVFDETGLFDERPRGADVIFVHQVLDRFGTEAVVYEPQAVVAHTEIDSALAYWRKAFIYGRSARRYQTAVHARPLNHRERLRVFWRVSRGKSYGLLTSAYLFSLLLVGVAAYGLGRWMPRGWSAQDPQTCPPKGESPATTP